MKKLSNLNKLQNSFQEMNNKYKNDFELIHKTFEDIGITEYCFIGGASLAVYNYMRSTTDADVLISEKDKMKLKDPPIGYIRDISDGRGRRFKIPGLKFSYVEAIYEGEILSRNSLEFPNPIKVRTKINGVWIINLLDLISTKLQSGMYGIGREQDISDVRKLILNNSLSINFASKLRTDLDLKYREIFNSLKDIDDINIRSAW